MRCGREGICRLLRLAAFLSLLGTVLLVLMIAVSALPLLVQGGSGGPFSWTWAPAQGRFGILPMVAGSFVVALSAVILGWPLAFGLTCWLLTPEGPAGRGRGWLRRGVGLLVRLMTAVPTVVYGFAAVFLLVPLVRTGFSGTGFCLLSAVLMLSLLVLPTVVLLLEAGLEPKLEAYALAGAAAGMSRREVLFHVVLPDSHGTLLSSCVLAFGRAAGDTMLPLMLAGNAPGFPDSPLGGLRTLTAHMALVTSNEVGGAAYGSLFMAGFLLILGNGCVSAWIRHLGRRNHALPKPVPACTGRQQPREAEHAAGVYPEISEPRRTGQGYREPDAGGISLPAALSRWGMAAFSLLMPLAACLVPAAVLTILGYLLLHGGPELGTRLLFGGADPLQAVLGRIPVWEGVWPACVGTFRLVVLTIGIAVFPGIGCGLYLSELAGERTRKILGGAMDLLAGMPSIVMGLFGFTLILFLRRTVLPQANTCLLLAACCLSLLVLPVLAASAREAARAVPPQLRLAAMACGMSKGETILYVVLPGAIRGLAGGVVLAVGRAAEDTAVILFTGVVASAGLAASLFESFEALPFFIYCTAAQYQGPEELARGFGAAVLLLCVSCLLLLASALLGRYARHRQSASL